MLEFLRKKEETKQLTESELMSSRERTEIEAVRRAEEKATLGIAEEKDAQAELESEAHEEDRNHEQVRPKKVA